MPVSKGRFVLFYYLIWLKIRLELPLTLFPPECHICTFSPDTHHTFEYTAYPSKHFHFHSLV